MAGFGRYCNFVARNLQLLLTILGITLGIVCGLTLRLANLSDYSIYLIGFPGLSQFDGAQSSKVGKYALLFYCITLMVAVVTGITVVLIIHPGRPTSKIILQSDRVDGFNVKAETRNTADNFLDLVRNMFPENLFEALLKHVETKRVFVDSFSVLKNGTKLRKKHLAVKPNHKSGTNIFGVIVISAVVGFGLSHLGDAVRPLKEVVLATEKIIVFIVNIIMWFAPVGVASVIAQKLLSLDNVGHTLITLGTFVITVVVALSIHLFITEPLLYFLAARKNPYRFLKGLSAAIMTAVGTSSSAASLPVTLVCLERNNRVDPRISKLVLPVGAVVNMDGTALYEALVAIFIAQVHGIQLSAAQIVSISFCAILASIGAAAIPSAGLVTILMVLSAANLPTTEISLIFAVDWLLDRYRTVVNLVGDAFGCGFVEALCKKSLEKNYENNINARYDNRSKPQLVSEDSASYKE